MKVFLLVIACLLVVAKAQPGPTPLFAWSGSTIQSPTNFTIPNDDSALDCTIDDDNDISHFVVVNFTVPTNGVYEIIGISDQSGDGDDFDLNVYLYSGTSFNNSGQCQGYIRRLTNNQDAVDEDIEIDDFQFLWSNTTYFLVASGDDFEEFGYFALAVFAPTFSGDNNGAPMWTFPNFETEDTPACTFPNEFNENAPLARNVWQQPTTGSFDIIVGWDTNGSEPEDIAVIMLYSGNVSVSVLQTDPCLTTTTGVSLVIGQQGGDGTGAAIYGVSLTQGQVYTLAFSGDEQDDFGRYGVQIVPTRMFALNTVDEWGPPGGEDNDPGFVTSCPAAEEDSTVSWFSTSWSSFNGLVSFVVFPDFEDISGWESTDTTFSYIYYGTNAGVPPTACPITATFIGGWEDDTLPALISSFNQTITVVASPFDDEVASDTGLLVYIIVGLPVGHINTTGLTTTTTTTTTAAATTTTTTTTTTTATTATTGNPTIGNPTIGNPTIGNPTTGTPVTPSPTTGTHVTPAPTNSPAPIATTSGASAVAASVVVVALSLIALL